MNFSVTATSMTNHTPSPFSSHVLDALEQTHTTPRPKSYFIVRNIAMWTLAGVSVVLGSLAVSSIIFRLHNVSRVLPPDVPRFESIHTAMLFIPLVWIITFLGFGYLAFREVRQTKKGYLYEFSTVMLLMVVTSGILGFALYKFGTGYAADRMAARFVPFHKDIELVQKEVWQNPARGFLLGDVVALSSSTVEVLDPEGERWTVVVATSSVLFDTAVLDIGSRIGVRGVFDVQNPFMFIACDIREVRVAANGNIQLPPPDAFAYKGPIARSQHEINPDGMRSNWCEGVRPPAISQ